MQPKVKFKQTLMLIIQQTDTTNNNNKERKKKTFMPRDRLLSNVLYRQLQCTCTKSNKQIIVEPNETLVGA